MKLVHVTTDVISMTFFDGQIQYLGKLGYEIHLIASPTVSIHDVLSESDAVFHPVSMKRQISPFRDLVSLTQLWKMFRRLKPGIVHSHTPKAGLLGTVAARCANVPIVFLSVFGLPQMTKSGFLRQLLDFTTWLSCRLADRVWCDSFSMREYIADKGLCDRNKIVVIGYGSVKGVDAERKFNRKKWSKGRQKIRESLRIPSDAPVIGFVGRIVREKGIHELVGAWQLLSNRFPDLHLILVGGFEKQDPISSVIKDVLMTEPRIHLTGPQSLVPPYLAAMDVYVMPSYREGFGITNIEAAAMELPVISTTIPGCIDSVVSGTTGTLVPPRNVVSLAEALEKYLDSPSLRSQHGRKGRDRVLREFKPESIWKELSNEYSKAVSNAKCAKAVDKRISVRSSP